LRENDIGCGVYYPVPIHQQTYYTQELGYDEQFPEAEKASVEVLSLPVHPALSQQDLDAIVKAVNTFMGGA
jgi:dTDP-4-amino-4,6-dideoxygalactose transaminase